MKLQDKIQYSVLESVRKTENNASVLFMFHGYGSNKEDLLGLASELGLPFQVVSLQAPRPVDMGGWMEGYAWFDIDFQQGSIGFNKLEVEESILVTQEFIHQFIQFQKIHPSKVFLLGFSQGTIIAQGIYFSKPDLISGMALLSGAAMGDDSGKSISETKNTKDFPVFVSHGVYDPVLNIQNGRNLREFYQRLRVNLTYQEYRMGHEINADCLQDLRGWFSRFV